MGHCLAKDARDRPPDAAALLAALDGAPPLADPSRVISVSAPAPAPEPAVAILPFTNLTSDPEDEYLSDGIPDEVIGTLGRQRGVRVAGRASCFALKGQRLDARTAGARLGVSWVVEGTLRRAGNRIRVSVELVDAADGFQRWSKRYDRELTDVFAVQDEIAQAIAVVLTDRLVRTDPPAGVASRAAAEPEAYRLYLLGMHTLRNQSTAQEFEDALALVERAVAIDPTLARAHVARAVIYNGLPIHSVRSARDARPKARAAARAALALDDHLAEAWAVDAEISYAFDWEWASGRSAFARALACDPNDSGTLARAAVFHAVSGDPDTAVSLARRAMTVDPLSAWTRFLAGTTFRLLRRYDDALAASNEAIELNPRHGRALSGLSQVLLLRGDLDGALDAADRAVALTEQSPLAVTTLAATHAARGDRGRAEACLNGMLRQHDSQRPAAVAIGLALAALGRHAEAVHWLQEAAVAREPWVTWLGAEPLADPLRGEPGFQALMRRIGAPAVYAVVPRSAQ